MQFSFVLGLTVTSRLLIPHERSIEEPKSVQKEDTRKRRLAAEKAFDLFKCQKKTIKLLIIFRRN